ncbi:MAG: hypothetical protein NZ556_01430 [Fimbriimonadales bacterium]|nr:hypothetical protein [Fimbriimonadales bacterium]
MRNWKVGCGVVFFVALLVCGGLGFWLLRPPPIEIPPRRYPPNNAYEEYRMMGEAMRTRFDNDVRFKQIEDAVQRGNPVPAADRAYYLRELEPYLRRYAELTRQPSFVVMEYDVAWLFPELAQMRRIARAEAYLMREDLKTRRPRRAVERAQRLTRLADQVRNGGVLIHYLVGVAINAIAIAPLREELPRLQDRATLEAIVNLVREYEKQRVPLWQCMQYESYFGQSIYRDIANGRTDYRSLLSDSPPTTPRPDSQIIGRILVNSALPEYKRMMNRNVEELKLPFHERPRRTEESIGKELRHPLNQILIPVFFQASEKEIEEVARMRLLGVAAAIRLYKQRTGKYPASLEALQLGEMTRDPFSGKPFVYRTDPRYGFLLYSVSRNRTDDGGATPYNGLADNRGDLSPVVIRLSRPVRPDAADQRPLAPPIWMR